MPFRAGYEEARDDHLSHFTDPLIVRFHRQREYRRIARSLESLRDSASGEERACADSALESTQEARRACK